MNGKQQQADRLLAQVKLWGMANSRRKLIHCVERYRDELEKASKNSGPFPDSASDMRRLGQADDPDAPLPASRKQP
jgi:hypothetical protein